MTLICFALSSSPKLPRRGTLTQLRRHPKAEGISHRGAHQTLPENSIPAFLHAIELDVHATSDGVVIVHHDPIVTAPGVATSRLLDLTASELSRFPLAHGIEIPTLGAVLNAIGDRAKVY